MKSWRVYRMSLGVGKAGDPIGRPWATVIAGSRKAAVRRAIEQKNASFAAETVFLTLSETEFSRAIEKLASPSGMFPDRKETR